VNDNGNMIKVKAVDYLKGVRDTRLNTSPENLAKIAADVAVHYVMLCREIIMEELRRDEFNFEPPSRQYCLYACNTLEEAQGWKRLVGEGSTVCELTCTGTIHRGDAHWLLGDSEPLSVTKDRARKYWRGTQVTVPSGKHCSSGMRRSRVLDCDSPNVLANSGTPVS
jgi:hypothetical protein